MRSTRRSQLGIALAAMGALGSSCGGAPHCADGLAARIAALASGETLVVGSACVVTGAISIRAGATVHGGTFALGPEDAITLVTATDDAPITTLEDAHITGGSAIASVRVVGPGHARIADTTFEVSRGIAIGVSGATVSVSGVQVTGNIDPSTAIDVPLVAPGASYATYGVAAIEGAVVTISGGTFARLANAGIVCTDATLEISDVALVENRGLGLAAFGCTMQRAERIEVTGTIAAPQLPGMGIALVDGSTMPNGLALHLHDAPGSGLFVDASTATLVDPVVTGMTQAGVWAEHGASLTITGGTFQDDAGAAIAAVGAALLDVRDTTVTGTTEALLPTGGGAGADTIADAIHVVQETGVPCVVAIADVSLVSNDRVGMVLDGGGAELALTIARARVETSDAELGAIAQNVDALPPDWDVDVTRVGSAITLDPSAAVLPVSGTGSVGVLMPPTISF